MPVAGMLTTAAKPTEEWPDGPVGIAPATHLSSENLISDLAVFQLSFDRAIIKLQGSGLNIVVPSELLA